MPKPNPVADLAAKLVQTLQRRREQGDDDFPTLAQLAARLDPPAETADVLKALKKKPFADQLLAARPDPASPVALTEDASRLASSPALLDFVLGQLYLPGKELHPLRRVVGKVDKRLQPTFAAVLTRKIADNALPSLAGVRVVKGKPHLYLKAFPPPHKPVELLAEKLVEALHAAKQGGTYPPTLRQLVARAGVQDAPELAKVLTNKAFTSPAVVAAKNHPEAPVALAADVDQLAGSAALLEFGVGLLSTEKKPLHPVAKVAAKVDARLRDAFTAAVERRVAAGDLPPAVAAARVKDVLHLCLRPYLPRLAPEVELAGKLLRTLEDHRRCGDYPVTLDRLVHESDPQAPPERVGKALAAKAFRPHALLALPDDPRSPVALAGDADQLARAPALLETVLASARTADNQAVPISDLAKQVGKALRLPFVAAVDQAVAAATLPEAVGCVRIKAKPYLFLVREVGAKPPAVPASAASQPPAAAVDFAALFDEAFEQTDRQNGSHNFVNLMELRGAVPVERAAFDAGLQLLRRAGRYTLSGAEGRHGITDAERAAGVNENGALLLYVSRRR